MSEKPEAAEIFDDELGFIKVSEELGQKILHFVVDECKETRMAVLQRALCILMCKQMAEACDSMEQLQLAIDFTKGCIEHDASSLYLHYAQEGGHG